MVESDTFISDIFYFIKSDLASNITDPLSGSRQNNEKFVMTSYPQRLVNYPVITLRITQLTANRAGMQTSAIDTEVTMEIRIWGKNISQRDKLFQQVVNRLKNIQYLSTTGSQDNGLHNFKILNSVEINEDGDETPKSKLINVGYTYYNPS